MKVNWAERLVVNNPVRVVIQRLIVRWITGATALQARARVLEIGCGRGAGARLILERFQPGVLHALDLDYRMIRDAGRYLKPDLKRRISLLVGDAVRLPYRDGGLDAVFGFGVLHHLPDWRQGVAEISRVLKVGGIYFLEEYYPPIYQNFLSRRIFRHPEEDRFSSRDLHQALREAGFAPRRLLEQPMLGILAVVTKQS